MNMVQQFVRLPEIIRIEGMKGDQLLRINSQINPQAEGFDDVTVGEYDLVPQESPDTATLRMVTAELLTEFSHNNPNLIPPDVLLEYVEIPYSAKRRVRESWEAQQAAAALEADREHEYRMKELEIKMIAAKRTASKGD